MTMRVHEATAAELDGWDAMAVDRPGGHVYQSRAWAEVRGRAGWRPHFLAFDDGFRLLALERPWAAIGGGSALLPRGPITAGEPARMTAERLVAAGDYLRDRGIDVVSSDAQVEAATGYPALIEAAGFRQIEEIQPARHRLSLPLGPGADEAAVFGNFEGRVRQRIRASDRAGLRTVRWDLAPSDTYGPGFEPPSAAEAIRPGDVAGATVPLGRLYAMLAAVAARKGFALAARDRFMDWSLTAMAAGHLLYIEVWSPDGGVLGGMTLYRHGGRLTSALSGDDESTRKAYPGVTQLLTWRGIQVAIRERCVEMDMDGADTRGRRWEPRPEDPLHGLYQFKRSFGGQWVQLTGNHERVYRPARYALGRLLGRIAGATRPTGG